MRAMYSPTVQMTGVGILLLGSLLAAEDEKGLLERGVALYWNGEYQNTIDLLSSESPAELSDGDVVLVQSH